MTRTLAAAALALAIATRLGAQTTPDVTTEFDSVRNRTIVTMEKMPLDREHDLGAFYAFDGPVQHAPVSEFTLHFVHMGAQWTYIYSNDVVLVLDDKTRLPITRVQRAMKASTNYVLEQMFIFVSLDQAAQIGRAHKVAMKVGVNEFVWSDSLQGAFRHMTAFAQGHDDAGAAERVGAGH